MSCLFQVSSLVTRVLVYHGINKLLIWISLTLPFLHHFSMALLVLWPAILIAVILGAVAGEDPGPYPASGVPYNSVASSSVGQYVQRYSAPYRETPSYGVQTGYEGYLVPAPQSGADSDEQGGLLSELSLTYEVVVLVTLDSLRLWQRSQILKVTVVTFYRFFLAASQVKEGESHQ